MVFYLQQGHDHHVAGLARNGAVHALRQLAHKVERNVVLLDAKSRGLDAVQLDAVDLVVAVPGHGVLGQDVQSAGTDRPRGAGGLMGHGDDTDRSITTVLQRLLNCVLIGVLGQGVNKAEAAPSVELLVLIPALGARVTPVGQLSLIPADDVAVGLSRRRDGNYVDGEVLPETLTEREVGARPAREDIGLPVRLNELGLRLLNGRRCLIRLGLVLRDEAGGVVDIVLHVAPRGAGGDRLLDPGAAERRHFWKGREGKEDVIILMI